MSLRPRQSQPWEYSPSPNLVSAETTRSQVIREVVLLDRGGIEYLISLRTRDLDPMSGSQRLRRWVSICPILDLYLFFAAIIYAV